MPGRSHPRRPPVEDFPVGTEVAWGKPGRAFWPATVIAHAGRFLVVRYRKDGAEGKVNTTIVHRLDEEGTA